MGGTSKTMSKCCQFDVNSVHVQGRGNPPSSLKTGVLHACLLASRLSKPGIVMQARIAIGGQIIIESLRVGEETCLGQLSAYSAFDGNTRGV